jgi:transposase
VRVTTLFRKLLSVTAFVVGVHLDEKRTLVVRVRPRWLRPRCGECGRKGPGYDSKGPRRWRAPNFGPVRVYLEYPLRRLSCSHCGGIRVERVPWAEHASWFCREVEELVAYMAQVTDLTSVTRLMGISWNAVEGIVHRLVSSRLDPNRLNGLRRIGIDEFSYRKRHRYLTVVVDHDQHRVVWVGHGRGAETLATFFNLLGNERLAKIELVTMDMAGGYIAAVRDHLPHAEIVFDRFHVQRLASDAVDRVRRSLWRDLQGTDAGGNIKKSRFVLLKRPWNLTRRDRQKLHEVQRTNRRLYRAYLLKEALAHALDYRQFARAEKALDEWLAWATRSRLPDFVRAARTVRKHRDGILAYVRHRLTNGPIEGINTRLRMIARRAFGFHWPQSLTAMFYLCTGGIELHPPLP